MDWVIVILGIGCVYFSVHVVVDYLKYKRVVEPRIEQLEQVKGKLRAKISEAEAELAGSRGTLEPAREEVERLEREYQDLHRQVAEETARQDPPNWRFPER